MPNTMGSGHVVKRNDPREEEVASRDEAAAVSRDGGDHDGADGHPEAVDLGAETRLQSLGKSPRPLPTAHVTPVDFEELRDIEVGEYRILRRLGLGGMAEVYLAQQTSLGRQVALKILRRDVLSGSNDVLLRRFEQEARAAAALTHENIVQVYGVGQERDLHFIAQEYVRGINLKQYLSRQGPPDAATAVRFARQIAAALKAASEAGIVHRDVKPENVMLTRKGRIKVADFGLAQLSRSENEVQLTQVGMTMGTPLYMSPEQVNGKPVDARSDLYSFGVTLYHLLAGEPPFRGETALAIAVKHLNEKPVPLSDWRPDLPRPLCELVHRMMAKSPAERPADAGEVLDELRRIGKRLDEGGTGTGDWAVPGRQRGWAVQRGPLLAFGLAALVVGCVSAALGWWTRPGNPLDRPPAPASIPKEPTILEQEYVAMHLGTPEAWQAIVDHYGDDPKARTAVAKAKLRLGLFALTDRRIDDAERRFDEVRTEFETDPGLKANALAGLAAVESLRDRPDESQRLILVELEPLRERLIPEMQRLVQETIRRNRAQPGTNVEEGLEDLFRDDEIGLD